MNVHLKGETKKKVKCFDFHHVPAKLCGGDVNVYGFPSYHTKEDLLLYVRYI